MKYEAPAATVFERNRHTFAVKMKPGHVAVFFSNQEVIHNADAPYAFEQNSNLYYLSGIDQEDTILLLFPDAPRPEWKEVLFVKPTSEKVQWYEGWKYSHEEASEASGVKQVKWADQFWSTLKSMLTHAEGLYLDFNEYDRRAETTITSAHHLAERMQKEFPGHLIARAFPILMELRMYKSREEIHQMRVAASITEKAFRRVLGFVRPGVWEYEIEAEIMHEFLRNRANGPAYESIIASGQNACVLHYIQNNQQCQAGEVILFDFGADYGNYSADMSRAIPVSGKFTDRQRNVYDAVLRVFKTARENMKPGIVLDEFNKEVGASMEKELVDLGLLSMEEVKEASPDDPAFKKYFPHGTAHFLGLDTHDIGDRFASLKPGAVLTCEPGIYIREEGLGIRLENDILITEEGYEDLMASIPIEAEEIETLMGEQ